MKTNQPTNLSAPRYRFAFEPTKLDLSFIRMGILKLSPGQWLTIQGTKARLVRISKAGDLWGTYGTNQTQFRLACQSWLAIDKSKAA